MKLRKFLVAALPAVLLASCASDEPTVNPGDETGNGKAVYAKIQIQVPSSTRSNTLEDPTDKTNSDAGYEIGQPYENAINNVTIVLATYDEGTKVYSPQAYGTYTCTAAMPDPKEDNTYTILFKDEEIVNLADEYVYIFAYCNTDYNKETSFSNDLADMIKSQGAGAGEGIWQSGNFMMTNAPGKAIVKLQLPEKKALINNYNSAEKALDLGTVDVARTAARFDYKPVNGNKFNIVDINATNKEAEDAILAQVEMVGMTPFNIAQEFYVLPRVSADGTSNAWEICGAELGGTKANYVVSPNLTLDQYSLPLPTTGNDLKYGALEYTNINEWYGKAADDNDAYWSAGKDDNDIEIDRTGYKIWHYVTENTLPGINSQKKGVTTGVIFKGQLTNAKGLMKEAMDNEKAIYFYNGVCYGNLANLRRVVANLDKSHKMYTDFEKVFKDKEYLVYEDKKNEADNTITRDYKVDDIDLEDCKAAENNGIFKILRPDSNGNYFTYYVYYNRHNDNNKPTEMGIMEFATVRNNVYKLSVTGVSDFGHTSDPKDDYDPEDPNDPDETPKTYFRVSCRVLPWVVRVNNIVF